LGLFLTILLKMFGVIDFSNNDDVVNSNKTNSIKQNEIIKKQ